MSRIKVTNMVNRKAACIVTEHFQIMSFMKVTTSTLEQTVYGPSVVDGGAGGHKTVLGELLVARVSRRRVGNLGPARPIVKTRLQRPQWPIGMHGNVGRYLGRQVVNAASLPRGQCTKGTYSSRAPYNERKAAQHKHDCRLDTAWTFQDEAT